MDLEDRILKFSLATDVKDDIRAEDADTGSEAEEAPAPSPGKVDGHDRRHPGPQRSGPKGVLDDKRWDDFQQSKRRERSALEAAHNRRLMNGGAEADGIGSMSLAAQRAAASQRRRRDSGTESEDADEVKASGRSAGGAAAASRGAAACHPAHDAAGDRLAGTGDAGGGSSEDEAFMQRFRAERLRQMRLRVGLGLPVYGGVVEIEDRLELPGAIDATDPRVHTLVLFWEPFIPAALAVRAAWPAVAAAHPHTRFIAMRSALASDSFDPIGLPAVAIYRAGKLLDSLLRLHDLCGGRGGGGVPRPSADDVAEVLAGARVLDGIDAPAPAALGSICGTGAGRGSDGDEEG